jgi:hypothetical protein
MEMKKLGLFTICLLLINSMAFAQARPAKHGKSGIKPLNYTGCDSTAPVVNINGAGFRDFINVFGDNFVQVNLKAGHSYAAEVWDPTEQNASNGVVLILDTAGCAGNDNYTDVTAMDPDLSNGFSDRISWVQASDSLEFIDISSFDTIAAHDYSMRVVDTTLYNARWSTVVGFSTHYGFLNTTELDIGGTLTLTESGGTQHVVTFTIPAGGEIFEVVAGDGSGSPGLNLPPNLAGSASFVFVGAAGAIKADGYFQAVQNGVFVIVPTAWGPKNNQ